MDTEIMALGWYVRFCMLSDMEAMEHHYADILGLPRAMIMRAVDGVGESKDHFWGGENIIVNHNYGRPDLDRDVSADAREADPATARQIQIFRVSDLDGIVERLRAKGATVLPIRPCFHGREAFVLDPMGMLIGLRQRDADSPLPQDREAVRRRIRGEAFNPGCGPMPQDWQEVGWVRITVADLPKVAAFYRDTVGLPFIGEADGDALFDLGDNTTLELTPGGVARPIPDKQISCPAVMILRVPNRAATIRKFQAANVPVVMALFQAVYGSLTYVSDPEGNVFGLMERVHPGDYFGKYAIVPEDLEAARRWAETKAARLGAPTH
jgi:predicted enzyme related to lactoylglutathione lyase